VTSELNSKSFPKIFLLMKKKRYTRARKENKKPLGFCECFERWPKKIHEPARRSMEHWYVTQAWHLGILHIV
jgi:hypothetical protein